MIFGPYLRTLVPSKIAPLPTGSGTARMTRAEGLAASHTDISEIETKSKAGRLTIFSQSKMEDSSDFHGPKKCELLEIIPFSVQRLTCVPKQHPIVKPPQKS